MAQAVGFSRALATVRRTVAARRDAERRARAVRIPPCNPCIVCRKNNKQHPARYCFWRRRWDSNPRDIAVKLISSQSRYDRFDTSAYLVLPHRLAQRLEKCEISMQDNDERLGTRHPIKPAVMGYPADKMTCRMQTFECDPFDLLGNAPYSNPPKSSPEKGEKSRREQQIFNCRKQWIFNDGSLENQ